MTAEDAVRMALNKGASMQEILDDVAGYQIVYPGADLIEEARDAGATEEDFHEAIRRYS